ncbi:MAG: hypothetical protein Q9221_002665 [Calogaya cf. arnoldii]
MSLYPTAFRLPSLDYPHSRKGFWGPVTATINWCEELLDELSKIYTTCVMFYATFSHKRSAEGALLVLALAVFIATFITAYYYHIKDPLFHQNAFALLTVNLYGMEASLRPSRQARRRVEVGRADANNATEQARVDQRDRNIIKTMYQMIPVGVGSIAFGFLIWNLDNAFCPTLRQWRRTKQIGEIPPLVIGAPRSVHDLDPVDYPLARLRMPASLRHAI